jgi:O-antigen biosynthesis protein
VSVIVPVFNAFEAVSECLAALHRHLPAYAEVVLLDDASTDPRISPLLACHAGPRTRIVKNVENQGYTRTVNKGIALTAGRDVVLLNSDTKVTARWLDALRYCAYAKPRVATVTALSDNAGAFSVPILGTHNPRPPHLREEEFARVVTSATDGTLLEVPTGNGFCMYMRRVALDSIGTFDEQRYPRGYGEENDFCLRALRQGWRNLVSDKAFVLHKRSQSFQGERETLLKAGREQLDRDYPEYGLLTSRFRDIEFNRLRSKVRKALESPTPQGLPAILYVISTQTGGTPQTNLDLMRAMADRHHCWLLRCDSVEITLSELVDDVLVVREIHPLSEPIEPITHRSDEYDQIVADILYRRSIELLHIRHIAWHSLNLPAIARSQNIPVVYSFHDFYSVCPSLNLLDNEQKYCGGRCTEADGDCPKSLWPDASLPTLKHRYVKRWQEMFREFLAQCDAFVTTAPSAARTIEGAYPEVAGKIVVIPHGRDFVACGQYSGRSESDGKIRVLIPGNIGPSKGSQILRDIAELDKQGRYEFHFLGSTAGMLKDVGVHHGTYDRSNFHREVRDIKPMFGLVFSIWAETYCHTLTEMWACGIPVLGMDIGAVGDRIRASGAGWLLSHRATPYEALGMLGAISADSEGYAQRLAAVERWQETEARWNDTATMAAQYRQTYDMLLAPGRGPRKCFGMLYRQKPYIPATAYIRSIMPWSAALQHAGHDSRAVDVPWLLSGGVDQVDALLIQRNAIPASHTTALLECLRERHIPYIYEIDDPLWDLPSDHPDRAAYAEQAESMMALIREAALVTTSTVALAERLGALNPKVEIVPNALDPTLWAAPLSESQVTRVLADHGLAQDGRPRVLYMGTSSHRQDLQLVIPALRALQNVHPELEVIQVGGGIELPGAKVLEVPKVAGQYPEFVGWFRTICSVATVAIAPLRDTEFNAMKSDIKALDYAWAGVAAVYSDVGPYRTAIKDGHNGLLAQNDEGTWTLRISQLLDDADLRARICRAAGDWARERSVEVEARLREIAAQTFGWKDQQ